MEGRDVKALLALLALVLTCLLGCAALYGINRSCEAVGGHLNSGLGQRGWTCSEHRRPTP